MKRGNATTSAYCAGPFHLYLTENSLGWGISRVSRRIGVTTSRVLLDFSIKTCWRNPYTLLQTECEILATLKSVTKLPLISVESGFHPERPVTSTLSPFAVSIFILKGISSVVLLGRSLQLPCPEDVEEARGIQQHTEARNT